LWPFVPKSTVVQEDINLIIKNQKLKVILLENSASMRQKYTTTKFPIGGFESKMQTPALAAVRHRHPSAT